MIDQGTYHGILTLVALIGFVAITLWAWSGRRKAEFDRAARAALENNEGDAR